MITYIQQVYPCKLGTVQATPGSCPLPDWMPLLTPPRPSSLIGCSPLQEGQNRSLESSSSSLQCPWLVEKKIFWDPPPPNV